MKGGLKDHASEYRYQYPYRRGQFELPEKSTNVWEKRPSANSEIDNKNRADITVGPVAKN